MNAPPPNRLCPRRRLPVGPHRFLQPRPLSAEEYFKLWRGGSLAEAQASFQFAIAYDAPAVRRLLSDVLHFAVLDGVDPTPANFVGSATLATRAPDAGGAAPCLLRLEVSRTRVSRGKWGRSPDGRRVRR